LAAAPLERDVSASVGEFVHGLKNAFPGALTGGPLLFHASRNGAAMEIELTPRADRVIGGLALPSLTVCIRFIDGNTQAQAALLAHMDRAMQRGGG
jgi:hypothetical protein